MAGRPRQDRSSIRAVVIAVRFPKSVVQLLDALVLHEKKQITAKGLAGTSSRTAVLEALIKMKAKQVGLFPGDEDEALLAKSQQPGRTILENSDEGTFESPQDVQPRKRVAQKEPPKKTPTKNKALGKASKKSARRRTVWTRLREPEV